MKKKVNHIIEGFCFCMITYFAGSGMATMLCKILKEDPWSWKEWSFKHKMIYWIVGTVLTVPIVIWTATSHTALEEKIEDELDD